jgi:hypothetical protein
MSNPRGLLGGAYIIVLECVCNVMFFFVGVWPTREELEIRTKFWFGKCKGRNGELYIIVPREMIRISFSVGDFGC